MNPEHSAVAAAIARAWRAVVRAFTPAPEARGSQQYGTDTTLFGAPTGQPRRRGPDPAKNEFWDPTGESTDFADPEPERDSERRR